MATSGDTLDIVLAFGAGDGVGVLVNLNGSKVCFLLEDIGVLIEDIGVFDADIGVLETVTGVLLTFDMLTGVLTEFVLDAIIFKTGVFGVFVLDADGFLTLGIILIFSILTVLQS